jgi:hypothetical protein
MKVILILHSMCECHDPLHDEFHWAFWNATGPKSACLSHAATTQSSCNSSKFERHLNLIIFTPFIVKNSTMLEKTLCITDGTILPNMQNAKASIAWLEKSHIKKRIKGKEIKGRRNKEKEILH